MADTIQNTLNQNTTSETAQQTNKPPQKKKSRKILRRSFLAIVIAGAAYAFYKWANKVPPFRTNKKIILLGFDGADPKLIEKWWDELPNLSRLKETGSFSYCSSSIPPESPVAWSCFAVGGNPGRHGVYDFLRRPVGSYQPTVESFVERDYAKFLFKEIPYKMPKAKLRRGGTAFWDVLSEKGVETTMIEVPVTFPAPNLSHGRVLSGLGVPDIRGVQATFHQFIYDSNADQTNDESTFGGKIIALEKQENDTYLGKIWGPYDPVLDELKRQKEKERLKAYLTFCEWYAHLLSFQGDRAASADKERLKQYMAKYVIQPYSLNKYLQTEDVSTRIEAMKHHLRTGQPFYKKTDKNGRPVVATIAREQYGKANKLAEDLTEEIGDPNVKGSLIQTIFAEVVFKPIDQNTIEITIQDHSEKVKINEWSGWFTVKFPVTRLITATAITRFYPQSITPNIDVFMSSPEIDPRNPIISISSPSDYSEQLADWVGGPYKTRGWAAETHGLKDGYLSEEGFMKDLLYLMDLREKKSFETIKHTDSNVFVSVFSETDRVCHMFTHLNDKNHPMYDPQMAEKYADSIKIIYKRMDDIVGRMLKEIEDEPDTTLIVMSDHGFSTWRYQVNLNTWLYKNGFMSFLGDELESKDKKLADLINSPNSEFFAYVDWSKTKAYALGLGQIYINKEGREPLGIVTDEEYQSVCKDICTKLVQLRDNNPDLPDDMDGTVVEYCKQRDEIWTGDYANDEHDCPDIQVGFKTGYRVSWQTCLGGISKEIIEPNMEKWGGDHCSLADTAVPGMFFSNKKISAQDVSIYDFAPTILNYFDFNAPEEMEGKNLLG